MRVAIDYLEKTEQQILNMVLKAINEKELDVTTKDVYEYFFTKDIDETTGEKIADFINNRRHLYLPNKMEFDNDIHRIIQQQLS